MEHVNIIVVKVKNKDKVNWKGKKESLILKKGLVLNVSLDDMKPKNVQDLMVKDKDVVFFHLKEKDYS